MDGAVLLILSIKRNPKSKMEEIDISVSDQIVVAGTRKHGSYHGHAVLAGANSPVPHRPSHKYSMKRSLLLEYSLALSWGPVSGNNHSVNNFTV